MASSRVRILNLYRSLLRESQHFSSYNYRSYALRRIRDAFKDHKSETDSERIKELYSYGIQNLEMIKRQVTIGKMYQTTPLVIEGVTPKMKQRS